MSTSEKIALVSVVISVVSMAVTILFALRASAASKRSLAYAAEANTHATSANTYSVNANDFAEKANIIAIGQMETSLREQITNARNRMEDSSLKIPDLLKGRERDGLTDSELQHLEVLENSWRSSIESYLNAYEDACGKFIDDKTDKDRFRKGYINEIKTICDHNRASFSRLMHPEATSQYEAIWKVYREWHRHE